jgi:pimeloyl-ACP methyl ester carboxylesterase
MTSSGVYHKTKIGVKNQASTANYTTGLVTSKDGTPIGYRQLGYGPGVLLLHGAMESAQSHMQLAEALADSFTVYLPDRRGRGSSGPHGKDYGIMKEVEDLEALLTKTDTHFIFGVSAGGLICLQAALNLPGIQKVALYEPVISIKGSVSTDFLPRFDRELADGNMAAALVSGMLGAQMGPPIFRAMPRWLLELLTSMQVAYEDKNFKGDGLPMRALAPTLHYDFQLVVEMTDKAESFRTIRADVLLLGGSESPAYLKIALHALEKIFPKARRVEFPGLNHGASGNANRGGQPELVAQELRRFFA